MIESEVKGQPGRTFINIFHRLFRKLPGVRFEGRIHEQVYPSLEKIGARIETSDIVIRHSGYCLSPERIREKARRNLELLSRQIQFDPDDGLSLFHAGEAHSMLGQYHQAVDYYERALKTKRLPIGIRPVVFQNLGSALIKIGDYENALVSLKKSLELNPQLSSAHILAASAYFAMKRYQKASREIETYIEKSRTSWRAGPLIHKPDIYRALVLLARCKIASGDVSDAINLLSDAVGIDPEAQEAHILLGKIAYEKMRFREAVQHFENAVASGDADESTYFELSRAYLADGSVDKAIEAIEKGIAAGHRSSRMFRCLGLLQIKKSNFSAAISSYEEALRLDPHDEDSRRKLAGLYIKIGRKEKALECLPGATN